MHIKYSKAGFHFGKFGRATKRWADQGMRSSKSKLKASVNWRTRGQFWKLNQVTFNFFVTRMSESQSDYFFSMLEHAIVPFRAPKFAEVETGLYMHINMLLAFLYS